jgi:hypothetical protein
MKKEGGDRPSPSSIELFCLEKAKTLSKSQRANAL